MSFQLWSNSFAEAGWIPELHSCKGADLSPSLEWSGEPGDVRSFALVVEDPDAPSGTFFFPWRSQRQRATVSTCDIVSPMELRNASNGLCPESR